MSDISGGSMKEFLKKHKMTMPAIFLSVILFLGFSAGIRAYLIDTDTAVNKTKIGGNNSHIEETFDPIVPSPGKTVTKRVSIKNDGPSASFIRVRLEESSGDVGKYADYIFNGQSGYNTDAWEKGDDGYYYYKGMLKPGETTPALIDGVSFSSSLPAFDIDSNEHSGTNSFDVIVYEESYSGVYKNSESDHTEFFKASEYKEAWEYYEQNK